VKSHAARSAGKPRVHQTSAQDRHILIISPASVGKSMPTASGWGRPAGETRFNDARYSTAAIGSDKSNGQKDGSIRPEMVEAGECFRSAKAEAEGSNRAEYIPWASRGNGAADTAKSKPWAARGNHSEGSSRQQCRSRNSKRNPKGGLI
jgi:hypothetical protein